MPLIVVADTGALLSLSLSGLMPKCRREFRLVIGTRVSAELKDISKGGDELGKAAADVLDGIEVKAAAHKYQKGEDEALALLAELDADILISDDIRFVKKNRNNNQVAFSVILLGILLEKREITKGDFAKAVDRIFEKRDWDENLIYLAAKYIIQEY